MEELKDTEDNEYNDEEMEPFFANYLREGYKVLMPVGKIIIEDKEGNTEVIAKTDGEGWRDNPPPRIVHEVITEDSTQLTVIVTKEQKDGSYIEIDRYEIAL